MSPSTSSVGVSASRGFRAPTASNHNFVRHLHKFSRRSSSAFLVGLGPGSSRRRGAAADPPTGGPLMKALTWHGKRDVRVDDVDDPKLQEPTDAIVRVTSTGLCGSDLHLYEVLGPFLGEGDIL